MVVYGMLAACVMVPVAPAAVTVEDRETVMVEAAVIIAGFEEMWAAQRPWK